MKNANINNEKIKYLTYEDVMEEYERIKNVESFVMINNHRGSYDIDELMNLSENIAKRLFKEVLKVSSDSYLNIILNFANLVDTNEKYIIIDSLLSIFYADIALSNKPEDFIDLELKQTLLNDTLKLLNSIKDNKSIIKSFVRESDSSKRLGFMFLNRKSLCEELLENKEFMKQSKNYNEVLNLFPQLKDKQR
ncbi:hypothetical protein HDR59_03680 [bacterium]|nr:hypothetical protein [bacterium]